MGLGITGSASCLARVFGVCFFLLLTIWVTPGNRTRELRTRGPTVLTQDSQGPQMVGLLLGPSEHTNSCISCIVHENQESQQNAPGPPLSTVVCKMFANVGFAATLVRANCNSNSFSMAEEEGFEPPDEFPRQRFSRPPV